jgi:hypothetical protein
VRARSIRLGGFYSERGVADSTKRGGDKRIERDGGRVDSDSTIQGITRQFRRLETQSITALAVRILLLNHWRMRIREFDDALSKIRKRESLRSFDFPYFNEQISPIGILNVSCDGDFSTYSPELLGMNLPKYRFFNFGNILENEFFEAVEAQNFDRYLKIFA